MALTRSDLQQIRNVVHDEVISSEKKILKKLEIVSHTLDKQTLEVAKRVSGIEEHLDLTSKN